MTTPETSDGAVTDAPTYCEQCGTTLAAGPFCPGCGQPIADDDATYGPDGRDAPEAPETDAAPGSPDPAATREWSEPPEMGDAEPSEAHRPVAVDAAVDAASRSRAPRGLIAGVLVAAVLIAAGVAAVVLLTSTSDDAGAAYRQKVATAFGPVLGANRKVSDELARLRGTKPTDARAAVRRAQQATTLATGAVGALSVASDSQQLARDTRQVLDRETAYLSVVGAVLANPSNPSRSQLQTLASNLTSAMSAAGPTVAGTSQTVSGADRLTSWAPRAARTLKQRAKLKAPAVASAATPPATLPANDGSDSVFSGVWLGEATQYAPRGTRQVVTLRTTIDTDGQFGSHREYIVGAGADSDCRGTLTRRGYGLYGYREGASSRCIATTSIRLTPAGARLRFYETYSTSAGVGRVVGELRRR